MHKPLAFAAAALVTLSLAGTSFAAQDESEWQPAEDYPPFTFAACGTQVTVDEGRNEVVERVVEQSNGTRIEFKGHLDLVLETADGRSAVVDASGPGKITITSTHTIVSMRGANLLMAVDAKGRRFHRENGLPTMALTEGPVLIHEVPGDEEGESTQTLRRAPIHVVDACTLLR